MFCLEDAALFLKEHGIAYCENEPLKNHTTWRIGGEARIMAEPSTLEQVKALALWCHNEEIPLAVLGQGSNLLVSEKGFSGVVLKLGEKLSRISVNGKIMTAQSGARIGQMAYLAAERSLSGLEFAEGIPGSIGGGLVMNAGAYGSWLAQLTLEIMYCDSFGDIYTLNSQDEHFAYRDSIFKRQDGKIILEAKFKLKTKDKAEILVQMAQYAQKRQQRQPLEWASCGSVFKNPPNYSVAQLIESVGAKGWAVNEAQVSLKHSNFIINKGNATSEDVLKLIHRIEEAVWKAYGIALEREVILW